MKIPKPTTTRSRRIPLDVVHTPAEALNKLNGLRKEKRENRLPILQRTPKFADFADQYLAHFEKAKDAKQPKTLKTERVYLDVWKKYVGGVRLTKITPDQIFGLRWLQMPENEPPPSVGGLSWSNGHLTRRKVPPHSAKTRERRSRSTLNSLTRMPLSTKLRGDPGLALNAPQLLLNRQAI